MCLGCPFFFSHSQNVVFVGDGIVAAGCQVVFLGFFHVLPILLLRSFAMSLG